MLTTPWLMKYFNTGKRYTWPNTPSKHTAVFVPWIAILAAFGRSALAERQHNRPRCSMAVRLGKIQGNTTTTFIDEKRLYICNVLLNLNYDKIETI
jgi:hypothetical protein